MEISLDILDSSKKTFTKPIHVEDLSEHGQITCIELSQYEWSQDVILIGFVNKIFLGRLKFSESIEVEIITEIPFPYNCTCLSLSLETNLNAIPCTVIFGAAGTDFKIRVIKTDLENDSICRILCGHSNYINDIKFDTENKFLASVSDDNTLKIWEVEHYKCIYSILLNFPGVAVQWHRQDAMKLLVADKMGIISLYNMETLKPILSLDAGKMLSSCHWCPSNSQIIASLQLGELSMWDVSVPSMPKNSNLVFTEAGGSVKFSPQGELVAALNSLEGSLKVFKTNSYRQEQQFSTFLNLPTNFCWHHRYPIICVGDDNKLCFFKVNTI